MRRTYKNGWKAKKDEMEEMEERRKQQCASFTFICALIKRAEKQKNEENKEPCIID